MTPKVLDHDLYPHLVGLILELADRDSLIRLRTASRSLRERADALLNSGTIVISEAATITDAWLMTNGGKRIPAFASWAWGLEADHPELRAIGEAADLRHTRLFDIVGLPAVKAPLDVLLGYEYGRKATRPIVRFMHNVTGSRESSFLAEPGYEPFFPLDAIVDDLVLFIALPQLVCNDIGGLFPNCEMVKPNRLVINISASPEDFVPYEHVRTHVETDTRRLQPLRADVAIWVFHESRESSAGECEEEDLDATELLLEIAVAVLSTLRAGAKTTVVGLEAVEWWLEDIEVDGDAVQDKFLNTVEQETPPYAGREEDLKDIRFLTLEEYRAEVGERAGIETIQSGIIEVAKHHEL